MLFLLLELVEMYKNKEYNCNILQDTHKNVGEC